MPSEFAWRMSLDGEPPRERTRFDVVAQRGGERYVWDRDADLGYFLSGSEETWPKCYVESRPLSISQMQQPPVAQRTAVDEAFVRYVRRRCLMERLVVRAGRRNSGSGRWLQTLVEGAQELDFLTEMLAHTVRRSGSEEAVDMLNNLPKTTEHWLLCTTPGFQRYHHSSQVGSRGQPRRFKSSHSLRCKWDSGEGSTHHDLVIFYAPRVDAVGEPFQVLYRTLEGQQAYENLGEMGSFVDAGAVEELDWNNISTDRAIEELNTVPHDDRASPHYLAHLTEVLLADRHQTFANVFYLAKTAALFEHGLIIERDTLRDEVAVYRRQLAMTGSGSTGWNIAGKESDVPHFGDAMRSYHRLVDKMKGFYFDYMDAKFEGSVDDRRSIFCACIYDILKKMQNMVTNRYSELLQGLLAALGNLEPVEQVSRSTQDAFDVYCRKHWKELFLNQLYASSDGSPRSNQRAVNEVVRKHMKSEFPEFFLSEEDMVSFEKIYNGLWETTVVLSLQRPPLKFLTAKSRTRTSYISAQHEFVDRVGQEGNIVTVLLPPIVKQHQQSSFLAPSKPLGSTVVEKGYVDVLEDSVRA